MKNILYIGIIAMLSLASCGESFLYVAPEGSIDQPALENLQGVDLLVTNAYANLTENGWGAGPFNWVFGSVLGGDANKGSDAGDQSVVNELETYTPLTTNGYVEEKWNWTYKGAQRVNMALKVIAKCKDLDPEFVKKRTGELKFLRALYFFEGVKLMGSTSLAWVDETFEENDPKVYNGTDIWPQIMGDIDDAILKLPEVQDQVGRANIWAARSLKAKMLMHQNKFSEAEPILAELLANGKTSNGLAYGLEDELNANFCAFTDNGKESIFAAQHSLDANNNGLPGFSLNYPHNVDNNAPGGCCGFFQPSYDLANAFQVDAQGLPYLDNSYRTKKSVSEFKDGKFVNHLEIPVDPRLDFAIGRQGLPYKDWGVCFQDGNGIRDRGNGGIFLPKKHVWTKKEEAAGLASRTRYDGWAPQVALNMQYLSVRDMVLLYAECLAEKGDLLGAMEQVNLIRRRANNDINKPKKDDGTFAANYQVAEYPQTHAAFADKGVCIEAIRFERRLELAMEGQRWYDLARWGGQYMSDHLWEYINYEKNFLSKFISASKLPPTRNTFFVPDNQIKNKGNDLEGKPYLQQNPAWK